jgi:phosphatidylserine decarboxylase
MVRDGIYYGAVLVAIGAVLAFVTHTYGLSAVALLLALFFLWFFRDPERAIPAGPGLIVSAADGKVTAIDEIAGVGRGLIRISVFLSVFDVHVNRSPVGGAVRGIEYKKGLYLNALKAESATENEQNRIAVATSDGVLVEFVQIAGLLARRIVCNKREGDTVQRGERIGMIKFGSRVDVIIPAGSQVMVKIGERVMGGSSVLARLPEVAGVRVVKHDEIEVGAFVEPGFGEVAI